MTERRSFRCSARLANFRRLSSYRAAFRSQRQNRYWTAGWRCWLDCWRITLGSCVCSLTDSWSTILIWDVFLWPFLADIVITAIVHITSSIGTVFVSRRGLGCEPFSVLASPSSLISWDHSLDTDLWQATDVLLAALWGGGLETCLFVRKEGNLDVDSPIAT